MPEDAKKKPEVDPNRSISGSFPGNSKKDRDEAASVDKKITPIEGLVVKVQKPSMAKRMREAFTGEDSASIGEYLLLQVAIPALKDLLFNMITGGANRALYGSGLANQNPVNNRRTGNVNYNQMSRNQVNGGPVQPNMSPRDMARHNFGNIVFGTRMEAEQVLSALMDLVERFDVAAVSDLYELVNVTGSFVDDKYGWYNLHGADIQPNRGGGFIIDLPAPQVIR